MNRDEMRVKILTPCLGFILAISLLPSAMHAQGAANVLLVVNEASPISLEIGQYYAQKRGIPAANTLRLKTVTDDSIDRAVYERTVEAPISSWLARNSAQDRTLYIVLTKGIPLRIAGSSGPEGTVASVDSELTLLYRKMTSQSVPLAGHINNPYFLGDSPISQAKRFTHEAQDIYLVSRLDGYTSADVRGLIDRGAAPSKDGKILLDEKESFTDKGNGWLIEAAETLRAKGLGARVILEGTGKVLTGESGVLGYYSWGSNDPAIRIRHFNFGFVPGALAGMFVSSDGRTFNEPPANWRIGTWEDKTSHFAGSPQSMAGDLIREGVTGIAAHVAEPYLEATVRPNILFPAYLSGFNLIESYYLSIPYLSWQTIVVGDPLCAPFQSRALSAEEIEKGLDPATEMPVFYSARRMRNLTLPAFKQAGIQPDAIKLALRAEARLAHQDLAGARTALEEATDKDSRIASAQLMLANLYEQSSEYDKAIVRYRRLIELAPDNPIVLNNLAYALAVRKNNPQEALPLAEKAYKLVKQSPNIADTLAWINHLLGNKEQAGQLVKEALQAAPDSAEIRLHAAAIDAADGKTDLAAQQLERALRLNPELEKREDTQQLRKLLQNPK